MYLKSPENQRTTDIYQNIVESIHQAAREAIGEKRKFNSAKIWWNDEIEEIIAQKKKAYMKWITTRLQEDRDTYNAMKRATRNKINKAKNEIWDKKCREIDTYIGGRKSTEVWKFIKNVKSTGKEKSNISVIRQQQWIQHYTELLQERRPQYRDEENAFNIQGENIEIDMEMVVENIKGLKQGRSCGPEGIYAELIKNGTKKLFHLLTTIFSRYINGEDVPDAWKQAYISSIHKKGKKDVCSNYRGISVTSTLSRLYGRLLRTLIEKEIDEQEEQCGFRAGDLARTMCSV
ncbi:uncharacterized protein LOC123315921 [Coccinella septempunctata]|uniref:uncharacterized protein LOC123315921 n=1 Tax=Coccinella septempunctata TaxID=41139 RepID=UPI001D07AE07|nr:uncharacterized protein LOC123315921 [Coccinella septempunctata]